MKNGTHLFRYGVADFECGIDNRYKQSVCGAGRKLAGPTFRHLLVARFNMVPELTRMIHREIEHVKAGRKGRIVLKMNGLHDQNMINELYNASENGVEIDLIVREFVAWFRTVRSVRISG